MKLKSMTTLMIKVTLKEVMGSNHALAKKKKCKFLMKVFEKYAPDKTDRLLI